MGVAREKMAEPIVARALDPEEVGRLGDGLRELAAWHNAIDSPFAGRYLVCSPDCILQDTAAGIREQRGRAYVVEEGSRIIAFSILSWRERWGQVDYLFVNKKNAGKVLARFCWTGQGNALFS